MADEIKNAKAGLADVLRNVEGLRHVYTYEPDAVNEFPAAVIRFTRRVHTTLGGSSFDGELTITALAGHGDSRKVTEVMDAMMDPIGAKSIEAAVDGDTTLGSAVSFARLEEVNSVGFRDFPFSPDVPIYAADFVYTFSKQVTT